VPDYELTVVGRMGPVVASCLPGLRPVAPPATVLHLLVSNPSVVLKLLAILADHHLTPVDIRINQDQPGVGGDRPVPPEPAAP
jgi:hypothetical protein